MFCLLPFAIGSFLFSLAVSITAMSIMPDSMLIMILSGYTVLMNGFILVVELDRFNKRDEHSSSLRGKRANTWLWALSHILSWLFMLAEVDSIFLMTSWALWAEFASQHALSILLICFIIQIFLAALCTELKHIHNKIHKKCLEYTMSVVSILDLAMIVWIILKG